MPRENLVKYATEDNESHVCSSKCAAQWLELFVRTQAEIDSGVQA